MENIFVKGLLFGDFSKWSPQLYERYYRKFGNIENFGVEYELTELDYKTLVGDKMEMFQSQFRFSRQYLYIFDFRTSRRGPSSRDYEIEQLFRVTCPKKTYKDMAEFYRKLDKFNITKFGSWHANYQVILNSRKRDYRLEIFSPQKHNEIVKELLKYLNDYNNICISSTRGLRYYLDMSFETKHKSASLHLKEVPVNNCNIFRIEDKYFPQALTAGQLLLAAYLNYSKDTRIIDYVHRNMDKYGLLFDPVDFVESLVDDFPNHSRPGNNFVLDSYHPETNSITESVHRQVLEGYPHQTPAQNEAHWTNQAQVRAVEVHQEIIEQHYQWHLIQ